MKNPVPISCLLVSSLRISIRHIDFLDTFNNFSFVPIDIYESRFKLLMSLIFREI